jgi:membrane fusion protein, heavy metal efflux system
MRTPDRGGKSTRLVLLLLVPALGCRGSAKQQGEEPPPLYERRGNLIVIPPSSPLRERIKVEPAAEQVIQSQLIAPASVEANPTRLAKITPPLSGRIERLFVRFGEEVKKGQPLLLLQAPDLVTAQADYLRAKGAAALAERNYNRQKDLFEHGIGAQRDLDQSQNDRAAALTDLDRAKHRLQQLGVAIDAPIGPLTVRSPIDGRVIDVSVAPGEFKNDPNAVLMIVADLSTVWLTASVQEKDVRRVQVGDEASAVFSAYPNQVFNGEVFLVADLLDLDTRTIKVRVAFDNSDRKLKPGMFATVHFASSSTARVVVPTSALILRGEESYVYAQVGDWTFEPRPVSTGEQQGPVTVITRGLDAGTPVVTAEAVVLQ